MCIRDSLLRARDVVGEVARQLGPLERKAKKARTYQELAAQQAEMSLTIAVDDLRGLQKEWDAAKAREAALAAELEAVSYTHLDVYKRQSWGRRPRWCCASLSAGPTISSAPMAGYCTFCPFSRWRAFCCTVP